jgi:CBS domain-containing protein
MVVRDIMSRAVVTVGREARLEHVARVMLQNEIGCVPVVDDHGRLVGLITAEHFLPQPKGVSFSTFRWPQVFGRWMPRDGIETLYAAGRELSAAEVMDGDAAVVAEDTSVEDAVQLMLRRDSRHLPVVRDEIPVGVLTARDLLLLMI